MGGKGPRTGGPDKRDRVRGNKGRVGESPADDLVLRQEEAPANQLDYDDRHDTRATRDTKSVKRYARLHKEKRKDAWARLVQWLVGFLVLFGAYLLAVVVMTRTLPPEMVHQATRIVGAAFLAAGAGVAAVIGGRAAWMRAYSWWTSRRR